MNVSSVLSSFLKAFTKIKRHKMAQANIKVNQLHYSLNYELLNTNSSNFLLILHGWGANKELMKKAFADEFKDFCHIYLDLCGFGKSSIIKPLNSFEYAQIITTFLKQKNFTPQIIIAHSFGGKIATLLSQKFHLKILVLLSSAGILWQKSLKVRLKIALFKALKWLKIPKFRSFFASKDVKDMNQTMYETFKKVVDEDFRQIFAQISCKTLIFWGIEDKATPLKSGETLHALVKNSQFYALKGDHFFFLQNAPFIAQQIVKAL